MTEQSTAGAQTTPGTDDLAAVRHLITTTLTKGFGSDEEAEAEEALLRDYFQRIADTNGTLIVTQPVRLVEASEALAAMRVMRLLYGQRQLMATLDELMPGKGFSTSGLLDSMEAAGEVLSTMLVAYLQEHGALPEATTEQVSGPPAPDPRLAALLRQMGGAPDA